MIGCTSFALNAFRNASCCCRMVPASLVVNSSGTGPLQAAVNASVVTKPASNFFINPVLRKFR